MLVIRLEMKTIVNVNREAAKIWALSWGKYDAFLEKWSIFIKC